MAYIDPEYGWFTPEQSDLNFAQTLRMTLRAPAVANRIFDTLEHAQAYIDDYSDKASAVPGILLAVVEDTDADKNGIWEVLTVKDSESAANGTMKRIDERSVVDVNNITTDLEKFVVPGIYFINNKTTNKGYVLFIELNAENQTVIQTLMDQNGYSYRTGANVIVDEKTVRSWTTWTAKTYSFSGHKHTTDDITVSGTEQTLTSRLNDMQLLIYAGLA